MPNTWQDYQGASRPLMVDKNGVCEPIKGGISTVAISSLEQNNASVGTLSCIAIGGLSTVGTNCAGSMAVGVQSAVANDAQNCVALGNDASCAVTRGIAIGAGSTSSGTTSTAIGAFSSATGTRSVSIGDGVVTTAADTITLGTQPVCLRLGTNTSAATLTSVATPSNANATSAGVPVGGIYCSTANPAVLYIRTA